MVSPDKYGRYMALTFHIAFGFLGGKEVKEEGVGNLGLQDRTYAMICKSLICAKVNVHRT